MNIRSHFCAAAIVSLSIVGCAKTDAEPPASNALPKVQIPDARPGVVEDRFARLALSCVHQEYPNKISHVMQSDEDVAQPRALHPIFYGCFDWHSSVHGHWLLVRILKTDPQTPMRASIEETLSRSFSFEAMEGEVRYFASRRGSSYERPYGLAWYLQLVAELHEGEEPLMKEWRETLRPLEDIIVADTTAWLDKLAYPIRLGTHNQTAFAFGLMLDYARTVGNEEFEAALTEKVRAFHIEDQNCPLAYEPSGEDFLSPCLMEADLMRRVMTPDAFRYWLTIFLPTIPTDGSADWLAPGVVLDPADGKLVHLDGVNLSRAWALEGIAAAIGKDDRRYASLMASAALHRDVGIKAVSDEHYSGSHWLGSFATYLTTGRGLPQQ